MVTIRKSRGKAERARKSSTAAKKSAAATSTAKTSLKTIIEAKPHDGTTTVTRQAIAEAAYFLWQKRGGNDVLNWLEAEATLKRQARLA